MSIRPPLGQKAKKWLSKKFWFLFFFQPDTPNLPVRAGQSFTRITQHRVHARHNDMIVCVSPHDVFFNFKIYLRVTRSTVSYAWAKGLDQPDVSIPSVFIALSAGRLLRTILSSQPGRGGGGGGGGGGDGGELVVTILPTRGLAQDWPSLLASAFIASVAVMVVLSTLFFLRHRNSPFGIIAGGTGAAAAAAAAAGGSRRSAGHPRLLTSSEVARIPVTYFSSETSHADEDGTHETCAVCLEDYEDGEELRGLVCGHQFHQPCVDPWLMTKRANCPVCKHVIRPPPSLLLPLHFANSSLANLWSAASPPPSAGITSPSRNT